MLTTLASLLAAGPFDSYDSDSGFIGPMMLLSSFSYLLLPLFALTTTAPVLLYVIARWRAQREAALDPQIGPKFAACFFRILGTQTALVGTFFASYALVAKGDNGEMMRAGFGFVFPGLIAFGAGAWMLGRTNHDWFPGVRRLFDGYNLMQTALIAFMALVLAWQAILAKGDNDTMTRLGITMTLVYGTAVTIQAWRFMDRVKPAEPIAASVSPPAAPPSAPPPPTSYAPPG